MSQLMNTSSHDESVTYQSPHELTPEQVLTAREAYERLGHHRFVRWNDLPAWQQAGYHRVALVEQISAMRQVIQLTGAVDEHQDGLVAAIAADIAGDGWAVTRPARSAGPALSTIGRDPHLEAFVRRVLHSAAQQLEPRTRA